MMIDGLMDVNGSMKAIRKLNIPNSVAPAFVFHPMGAVSRPERTASVPETETDPDGSSLTHSAAAPARIEDLAFATIGELAALLLNRKITSVALTQMYLDRLKRYDQDAALRHHADRRSRAEAGGSGRRGDCGGQVSRAAARDSVGREGPAGGERLSHDVGRGRVRAPGV